MKSSNYESKTNPVTVLDDKKYLYAVCIPMVIFLSLCGAVDIWWLIEVMKCYIYFKEKEEWAHSKSLLPPARASYSANEAKYY